MRNYATISCVQKGVREKNCFREHDFLYGFPF